MDLGSKTILGELKNWLEDYAPADQIEKCAASLEQMNRADLRCQREELVGEVEKGVADIFDGHYIRLVDDPISQAKADVDAFLTKLKGDES